MKTLKEYADFLYENGYEESVAPYTFLCGNLEIVEFVKNGYHINLYLSETKEFSDYLSSLEPGTEYKLEYENYIVKSAFIESPICNVPDYFYGTLEGIELVSEPNGYNTHTLDLFELCINFQKTNLLEHELFIMSRRIEDLTWAKDNLIPILEKYDFYANYDSFFDVKEERISSNVTLSFKHPNRAEFVIEIDCLTGKPIIWADTESVNGTINLTDKIYGKKLNEVSNILLEELFKRNEHKFGYIYNDDAHETIETYGEVLNLMTCIEHNEKRDINFDVIPKRYEKWTEKYHKLFQ